MQKASKQESCKTRSATVGTDPSGATQGARGEAHTQIIAKQHAASSTDEAYAPHAAQVLDADPEWHHNGRLFSGLLQTHTQSTR